VNVLKNTSRIIKQAYEDPVPLGKCLINKKRTLLLLLRWEMRGGQYVVYRSSKTQAKKDESNYPQKKNK